MALDHGYAKLLHKKAIKERLLVHANIWHARGIDIVVLWYRTKRSDGEKYLSSFENSSKAVAKKRGNGHRLAIVRYFSRGELSSLPRPYISPPIDEQFRGVLLNLGSSMPTSMLVEVGGGIFSTKFLIHVLNCSRERLPTPKNVAGGH